MQPGENYRILKRILQGTSLDDIPISAVGGDVDPGRTRALAGKPVRLTEEQAVAVRQWFDATHEAVHP